MRSKPLLSDQLRKAIRDCGITRYRIAKDTGVPQSALSRFVSGTAGLSLTSIDSIGQVIGAKLVIDRPQK